MLAAFAVMLLHTSSRNYTSSVSQEVFRFYGSTVRWAVPMFLMISGSLFLSRDIPVRKIYGKYILRIFTAYLSWSAVYALAVYRETGASAEIIPNIMTGHYHMWFLPMIMTMYMLVPFLKKVADSQFLTRYFLVLSFIAVFVVPQILRLVSPISEYYDEAAKKLADNFHLSIFSTHVGYFVFGYVMSRIKLSRNVERMIYVLGVLGFLGTFLYSRYSLQNDSLYTRYPIGSGLSVLFQATAIFVLFKEHCPANEKVRDFFRVLAKYSFGAYLAHEAVIHLLRKLGLNLLLFDTRLSVPVIASATFVVAFGISAVLNQIPVLRKYIV